MVEVRVSFLEYYCKIYSRAFPFSLRIISYNNSGEIITTLFKSHGLVLSSSAVVNDSVVK